ncbi:energy-coupled thiamine transporter ThiT [Clostridium oceanicum]|uniref:Thiamine transporter ThiT n=1 Tax=Clostridium oceanicum TaxID=1543 RepID=A0ABP3UY42_9CLOT
MDIKNILIMVVSIVFLGIYLAKLRKTKITTKSMVVVAMFSALSYILYMIQFIKYPQGGGISLFSMLPAMILSIVYGTSEGLTCGLIFGLCKLLNGAVIIHPAQFLLDYILSTMALGLAGVFGNDKKSKMILGCLLAVVVSVSINIVSGAVYFGQYAPEGMNVWVYSFIYNATSAGVEGLLTTVVVVLLPIKKLKTVVNLN